MRKHLRNATDLRYISFPSNGTIHPELANTRGDESRRLPRTTGEKCPVCGSSAFEAIKALRDNRTEAFQDRRFQVARCVRCRTVGLRPLPTDDELMTGYEHGYGPFPSASTSPGSDHRVRLSLREVAKDRLRHWWHVLDGSATLDRVTLRGRVLDVGAGQGTDVSYLLRRGYDAIGLEPNPRAVESCVARGIPVVQGTLDSHDFGPEQFDTILLNQVIEHLRAPQESLREVHRLLRPGGRVVIFTPNVESVPATVFSGDWAHWHIPYHLHLFGPAQLSRILRDAGFKVASLKTVTPAFWLNMSRHLQRQQSQRTDYRMPSTTGQPHPVVRVAIAPVFRTIDLLRRGDCLIAVGEVQ